MPEQRPLRVLVCVAFACAGLAWWGSHPVEAPRAVRRLEQEAEAETTFVFETVDGGHNRACRGASATDNRRAYFDLFEEVGMTEEGCKAHCRAVLDCQGIEFSPRTGRCEVWTRDGGITASVPNQGSICLRYVALSRFEQLPGPDGACRGAHENDNKASYFTVLSSVDSLAKCERRCLTTTGCRGVEYNEGAKRCEVWTRPEGIGAVKDLNGYTCLRIVRPQNCEVYNSMNDTDLAGVLLTEVRTNSSEECCSACEVTEGCGGFSYLAQSCFLKGNISGTFSNSGCVTRIKSMPPVSCNGFMESREDTDLAGDLISAGFALSADHCCSSCSGVAACEGFAFFDHMCYLKSNLTGTYSNPGCETRFKSIPGNCSGLSELLEDMDVAGELLAEVFAPSVDLCCNHCRATAGCEGFSYFGRMCFLKTVVTGTYYNPGRRSRVLTPVVELDPSPSSTTGSVDSCSGYTATLENTDLAGDLINDTYAASEAACCGLCGATQGCEGFVYLDEWKRCYLKNNLSGTYTQTGAIARVLLNEGSCDGFNPAPSDSDLVGDLLSTAFALSAGECCSICRGTAACEGFTHLFQACYLKANVSGVWHNAGRVSFCQGACPVGPS